MFTYTPNGRNARPRRLQIIILAIVSVFVLQQLVSIFSTASATGSGSNSLTTLGVPYTQDFNTLALTGTSSTLPTGWYFEESLANANGTYTAGTGSGTAGDTYSFGAASNSERAFGELQSGTLIPTIGASFTNNTGDTVNRLEISYTGEEWRLGTAGRADRLDFQISTDATSLITGTWSDVNTLDFSSPVTTIPIGALNGNVAPNRTAISAAITGLNIAPGATFFIRWTDFNASGADDGLAVDDFSLTPKHSSDPSGVGAANPNSVQPGATTLLTVTVTPGSSPPSTGLAVKGDLTSIGGSATQTFFDNNTNGDATAGDLVFSYLATVAPLTTPGAKTIPTTITDDQGRTVGANISLTVEPPFVAIHDIQGSATTSPYATQLVTTIGIVTGRRNNGYFIQMPDADADANPETSEGVFVFTSSAPPATAAVGNSVKVIGTVQEFRGDPNSPPATEIAGSPSTNVLSTGNPLPTPVILTAAETTNPSETTNPLDTLEEYEGMRVTVPSMTVVSPTDGTTNEQNATGASDGVFYGVVTGVPRPFREPGIAISDPVPAPNPPNVPRFDENPERLRVDSDAQPGAAALEATTGATIANVTGPLDYAFRTYTILPDPGTLTQASVVGNISAIPVPAVASDQFTVASFNMQRFFDTVNNPGVDDVALTPTAFANRLNKASLAIRNVMRTPDVIGVSEMENLTTLQAVATKVNNDAVAAGDPDPNYQAYLVEGNDIGGIDVGFLVKSALVHDTTPRVTVVDVQQLELATCDHVTASTCYNYINPNNSQAEILNDRPPLVLHAVINHPDGPTFPVTIIVNHLRSLSGVDDAVDGNRVRTKRRAQAEFLANYIQTRQTTDPNEHIVSVGDYNVFQFNDGFVDSMGTIRGMPAPADQVVLPSSDLVNPDLIDLVEQAPADQQYSFMFDGNAQELDHIVITNNMFTRLASINYARNDADFPESYRSDPTRPERISDHDPIIAYFTFPRADLSITKTGSPNTVMTGSDITYTIKITNSMNDPAVSLEMKDTVPSNTTFQSLASPSGWSCTMPSTGGTGSISCTSASLDPGAEAVFTLVVNVNCDVSNGTTISNTATVSSVTLDPDPSNNSMTATTMASNPPPQITGASASPSSLWPPNHKMVDVTVNYGTTDNCGPVICTLTVTSNEPVIGIGDGGDTSPDWEVIDAHHVRLRAERSGTGSGRTYTITITCTDSAGNSSSQNVYVNVPKSNK